MLHFTLRTCFHLQKKAIGISVLGLEICSRVDAWFVMARSAKFIHWTDFHFSDFIAKTDLIFEYNKLKLPRDEQNDMLWGWNVILWGWISSELALEHYRIRNGKVFWGFLVYLWLRAGMGRPHTTVLSAPMSNNRPVSKFHDSLSV